MKTKLDLLNNVLNILIVIIVLTTFGFSIQKYKINKNYTVFGQVRCPEGDTNGCFVMDCEGGKEEDARCENTSSDGKFYYKFIEQTATTENLTCTENDTNCKIISCTQENISIYDPSATCAE